MVIDINKIEQIIDNYRLKSKVQSRDFVYKRACVSMFLRNNDYTLQEIGTLLNRSHGTIIHSIKVYKDNYQYPDFYNYAESIEDDLSDSIVNKEDKKYLELSELEQSIIECRYFIDFLNIKKSILSK